jgi:glutamyl-tRNA synthetase/nondiscriminating glutamyl-tRNA synthetase
MKKVRVRYAPSPTGLLHIGNARSALFNYLYARHFNGEFIVRIEDTDVLRNVEGGEASQLNYLSWLGLSWDESPDKGGPVGPYRQLERLDLYTKYANQLLEQGLAYKDYREGSDTYAIRFKVPENKTYVFNDLVRGKLSFESKEVEDWIIVKDNGIPTYNFAVVIDDHFMEISHVLRGEEHITNTPKQLMIYQAFGWEAPLFGHMTIIVNEQKKKLSKRDKDVVQFISEYEQMGYLPEAMFNFISLLGWSPQGNKEILSQDKIIAQFDPKRLSKAPAMFDKDKLAYINSRYIKKLSIDDLATKIKPFLDKAEIEIPDEDWLKLLSSVFQDRLSYIGQIVELYHEFFHDDFKLTDEAYQFLVENESLNLIETFKNMLEDKPFEVDILDQAIQDVSKKLDINGKPLYMGIRIAATGDMHGPSLANCMALLEKDRVLNRLQKVADKLRGDL